MPYPTFDRSRLLIKPLSERVHDLTTADLMGLEDPYPPFDHPNMPVLAKAVVQARRQGAAVILMMGGHVVRSGVQSHIIDLMSRGILTHVAMNGGASIHDYELALIGATTENVSRYVAEGQFGLWHETGQMNEAISQGAKDGLGLGEALGRAIELGQFRNRSRSVLAAGYRLRIPTTVHVGIGYDIIHEHPNCDGADLGVSSYRDFLAFAQSVTTLEGGVLLTFGTAVMGPEVLLKSLAMARNVAHQEGRRIVRFTSAVFDLQVLPEDVSQEAARGTPEYYFRPYKTLLVRTISDGGKSYYFRGEHRSTLPTLYHKIIETL